MLEGQVCPLTSNSRSIPSYQANLSLISEIQPHYATAEQAFHQDNIGVESPDTSKDLFENQKNMLTKTQHFRLSVK